MQKRGQIMLFVILGIIIVGAIVFGVAMRKTLFRASAEAGVKEAGSFAEEVKAVEMHIEGCIEEALKEAVPWFGNTYFESYEEYAENVAGFVQDKTKACLNFAQFKGMEIVKDDEPKISIYLNSDKTIIGAEADFKVKLSKGNNQQSFTKFSVQLPLKSKIYRAE